MNRAIVIRRRSQLTMRLALLGLVVAVAFGIYLGIHPEVKNSAAFRVGVASLILCPGSLLFAFFIDAQPWTNGFFFMWLIIGLVNFGLYGAIGAIIGRLPWTPTD
jgi:EamA domain-containing membrane protein RarD